MSTVLDITKHLPGKPELNVGVPLQILTRLHQLNKIDNVAFGVGALVLSRMQTAGRYECEITRQELVDGYISLDGEPFAAVTNPEIDELARALYALQAFCGLFNHNKPHRVGKGTERHNHFAEKYLLQGDEALRQIIKRDTPIYFAWVPEREDEVVADVHDIISHQLRIAKWADVRNVKL